MPVPYVFGNATTAIPLTNLDANFNTGLTIGNTTVGLGNTVTSLGNVTLNNVTITSGSINAAISHAYANANAVVYSNSSSIGTTSTALTFNGTNLGVGTNAPDYKFVVEGTGTDERVYIRNKNSSNVGNQYFIVSANTGNSITTFIPGSGNSYSNQFQYPLLESATTLNLSGINDVRFFTQNTNRMIIDSAGNVGIGTSSPTQSVDLVRNQNASTWYSVTNTNAGSGAAAGYLLTNNTGALGALGLNSSTNTTSGSGDSLVLRTLSTNSLCFGTNSTERMRITSAGYVGIGITSPKTYLQIDGSNVSGRGQLSLNGGSGGIAQLSLYNGDTSATNLTGQLYTLGDNISVHLSAYQSTGYIAFETNVNTERMRIDSNGNVGIGTSSPIQKLHIGGNGNIYATSGATWYTGGDLYIRAGTGGILRLGANNANDLLILNTSGNLVLNGGNTTANGVGVTFPATQSASSDANTLDDYEEGTWTPTVLWGGSDTGAVYAFQVGTYTKIGNVVYYQGYTQMTTNSSATGNFTVGGLPFTSRGTSNLLTIGNVALDNASSNITQPKGRISTTATSIEIMSGTDTNNWGLLTSSIRSGAFRVFVSGFYYV